MTFKVYQNEQLKKSFPDAALADAEKYARRLGPGAWITDGRKEIAAIVRGSFPRCKIVTQVSTYGGKYL